MTDHSSYDLLRAVREGNVNLASALIASFGLSYSEAWSGGYIFLCEALKRNHTTIATILLEHGSTVNTKEKYRTDTPLHLAIKNVHAEIVAMLLDRGANVDARNYLGETPLHLSIKENNLEIISLLLNKNAKVNAKNDLGETPFHLAIVKANVEIVDHLLNNGALVDIACEENGYTPLHCAISKNRKEIVEVLLKRGANINARTKKQSTALHLAAEMEFHDIVKVLLEHGGVDIDAEDVGGKTVLNIAIERGDLPTMENILAICPQLDNEKHRHCIRDYLCGPGNEGPYRSLIVKTFLSHGFGVHPEDASNRKLLHIAVEEGYTKIVEDLLRYGADVDSPHVTKKGYTLLHNAAFNKQLDIAEILIKHGADVNAINETGSSPISYAIERIDAKMTKLLVSSGAAIKFNPDLLDYCVDRNVKDIIEMMLNYDVDLDIMAKGKYGGTALWYVVAFASPANLAEDEDRRRIERDLAELLLSRGFKVDAKDESVQDSLHRAIMGRRDDFVEVLLRYHVDVNFTIGIDMQTPLHCSASIGNEQISRMLLNAGAASSAKDITGKTPLHYACQSECKDEYNERIVDTLLKFGAEIDNKDGEESTPLHIAAFNGSLKIVQTLLKSFAGVECTDKDGKTALHVASERGWPKVVRELLDYGADPNVTCKKGHSPFDYAMISEYNYDAEDFLDSDHDDFHDSSDDVMSLRSKSVSTADTIKQHIIKIKSLEIHDNKRNLETVELDDEFEDFQAECEREVGLMKSERIGETNISYYYVLMKSMNQLAMLARNKDIVEVLESSRCRKKFPIYYKMMNYKFKKGQRRENLLNPTLKSLKSLSGFALPELVSLKVLDELSNKEFEDLIKAGPETDSRSKIR